mmetsp:Transcript_33291/g.67185  ORF Transcript_33291/g.67185 Transcript_33291/m.67185 type:complete len:470 (-) Transcript_33291:258-1667(-)
MPLSIHDSGSAVLHHEKNAASASAHHRRISSCRLFDAIETRQWDLAIDRCQYSPGEASQWGTVTLRGCNVQLLPLHYACALQPPTRLVRALLEADPDTVMIADDSGRLPIHFAVDAAGSSPEVVNLLLEAYPKGASYHENKWGFTPLHICCYQGSDTDSDVSADQFKIVELLLKANPAAVSSKDHKSWLPLHVYARTGSDSAILLRLVNAYHRGVREVDSKGRTPLHVACMNGGSDNIGMVSVLIDLYPGALSAKEKQHSFLPLHMACSVPYASDSLIKLLLEKNPNAIKKPDSCSSLPLHLAVRSKAPSSVIKRLLASYPAAAMQLDVDGRLALHWACKMCFSNATIKMLIAAYPGSIFVRENKYGYTSLAIACMSPLHESVFEVLLSRSRAVASVADKHGALPLHLACINYSQLSPSIVKSLIEAYPQAIEARDKEGRTPFDIACLVIDTAQRTELQQILNETVVPR